MTTSMVTGANGAIGLAISKKLAEAGHRVVMVCRHPGRGEAAVEAVRRVTGSDRVELRLADLGRLASIRELAADFEGPLDVLVNNAASTPRVRTVTPEGIEVNFATNVLGYVWMMSAFRGALASAAPSRIVNVASYWAGGLDLSDLQFERRRYDNGTAYRQSKQADRMLTVAFAERFADDGISVNSCHPGEVNSKLSNALGFGGHETPEEGAATVVWLATDPAGGDHTGHYFVNSAEAHCHFSHDRSTIEALVALCDRTLEDTH